MTPCEGCGLENGPSFRFCVGCGASLPRRSMLPPSAITSAPPAVHRADDPVTWIATTPPKSALELVGTAIDGSSTGTHRLLEETTVFGRLDARHANDRYLSPRHVALTPQGERLLVRDVGSLNGVFRRLPAGRSFPLAHGHELRLGRQLLRFEALAPPPVGEVERLGAPLDGHLGRLVHVLGRRSTGAAHVVSHRGLAIGRERGDLRFPDDPYVSGTHCRIGIEGGSVFVTDLGSSNGTYLRIADEATLDPGDVVLVGQQLLRVALATR